MAESSGLVHHSWWWTFLGYFVLGVVVGAVSTVLGFIPFVGAVATIVLYPFVLTYVVAMYFQARGEGGLIDAVTGYVAPGSVGGAPAYSHQAAPYAAPGAPPMPPAPPVAGAAWQPPAPPVAGPAPAAAPVPPAPQAQAPSAQGYAPAPPPFSPPAAPVPGQALPQPPVAADDATAATQAAAAARGPGTAAGCRRCARATAARTPRAAGAAERAVTV